MSPRQLQRWQLRGRVGVGVRARTPDPWKDPKQTDI